MHINIAKYRTSSETSEKDFTICTVNFTASQNDPGTVAAGVIVALLVDRLRGHDLLIFCVGETSHHLVCTRGPTSEVMAERDVNMQAVPQTVFHPSNTALILYPHSRSVKRTIL